jgi:hypothetical protein
MLNYTDLNRQLKSNNFKIFKNNFLLNWSCFHPTLSIFSDNFFINSSFLNVLNYNYFNNDLNLESIDESYENIKLTNLIFFNNFKFLINTYNNFEKNMSYSTILNSFRADYDETI